MKLNYSEAVKLQDKIMIFLIDNNNVKLRRHWDVETNEVELKRQLDFVKDLKKILLEFTE